MTLRLNTIERIFTPRLTDLATDTTLAAAARHDFSAITITIPEVVSRTFRSVKVEVSWRESQSSASNITGWRIGCKLGAAAFSDQDFSSTIANSADPVAAIFTADFTSYFASNFGSSDTQTCQIGVAMSTAAARTWRNIAAKLIITYEHDDEDTGNPIQNVARTLRIPIQSHHTTLTTSHVEIGTTGGTTNAPANQIPRLDGGADPWLPNTYLVHDIWIEVIGQTEDNATDYTLYAQIDSATEIALAQIEGGLFGSTWYKAVVDLAGLDLTAAHAFKLRSDVTGMFPCVGAILHLTYSFDPMECVTDGFAIQSLVLPLKGTDSNQGFYPYDSSRAELYPFEVDVQEPDTIELMQSGVVLQYALTGGATFNAGAGLQTPRAYTWPTPGSGTLAGCTPVVHRIDHSSGFSLSARGKNETGFVQSYLSAGAIATMLGGYVLLNYKSGVADVPSFFRHARSTYWHINSGTATSSVREAATADQRTPVIPETQHRLLGVMFRQYAYGVGTQTCPIAAAIGAGEFSGDGWVRKLKGQLWSTGDLAHFEQNYDFTDDCNRDPTSAILDAELGGYRLNIQTARVWRRHATGTFIDQCELVVTHHSFAYDVEISGAPASAIVHIIDPARGMPVGAFEVDGSGEGTAILYDDTVDVIVTVVDGADTYATSPGTPGVDTFELLLASGGAPPVVALVSPAEGALGADDPLVIDVTADVDLSLVALHAALGGSPVLVPVYLAGAWQSGYGASSSAPIAGGLRLTVRRTAGWPPGDVQTSAHVVAGGELTTGAWSWFVAGVVVTPEPLPVVDGELAAVDHVAAALARLPQQCRGDA